MGAVIDVYWPLDERCYRGRIVRFDPFKVQHLGESLSTSFAHEPTSASLTLASARNASTDACQRHGQPGDRFS